MKKLFKELFYVPKYGKVREKVMIMQVAMSVSIIVMCLAAMSLSAYAFFSYNVTSGSNTIKAANFEAKVDVQIANETGEPVEVKPSDDNAYTAELKANTEYFITLQATDRSTAKTGFVIITTENCDSKYHTEQLNKDANGNPKIVTFWLKPNATTKVTFLSRWGTSSFYSNYIQTGENTELYILTNDHVALSVNPAANNLLSNHTGDKGETTPTNTTTPPETESAIAPAQTTPSETAGTSNPTTATEPISTTAPSAPTDATAPATEIPTPPTQTTPSETTETSEPTTSTEPSSTTEPSALTDTTEPTVALPTEITEATVALPTEITEATGNVAP